MTAVRLCTTLNVWNGIALALYWTNRAYVCIIGVCLNFKLLFVFDAVLWGRNFTVMCCPNARHWRWRICVYYVRWMYGTVSFWPWTNRQCVYYWRVLETVIRFTEVWGRNPWWCAIQMHYNVDDGCALFMFVECMERFRVVPGQTGRAFILVCVWILNCYSYAIEHEVLIIPPSWCTVQLNCNGRWWRLCVCVRWMYYGTVPCWPWTNRGCVCIHVYLN